MLYAHSWTSNIAVVLIKIIHTDMACNMCIMSTANYDNDDDKESLSLTRSDLDHPNTTNTECKLKI